MLGLIPQDEIEYRALSNRGLRLETCRRWKYGVAEYKGQTVQVAQWADSSGTVRCQKIRFANRDFKILGDMAYMGLYGIEKIKDAGKMVVVTEGELDALAVSQAFDLSWPVVSIPNGAKNARKALSQSLETLEGFERVVLCFDNDEAGQDAIQNSLDLFSPGRVRIAHLPLKDACDMVAAGRTRELTEAIWNAKIYRPDGIISGDDILEAILNAPNNQGDPYPWQGLEEKLKGRRPKELILLTGGTGGGKSTVARQLAHHCLKNGETVGYIALEESVAQSGLGIYGCELGSNLRLADTLPEADLRDVHGALGGRLHLVDHFGSVGSDYLTSKIRFMAKALDCRVVFLDHISIAISGLAIEDERKAIDKMMTDLRSLVEETHITLYVVSHLRKSNDGKAHEEGGQIHLRDLRGSHTLAQIPDIVLAFERNSQAEGDDDRNTVTVRCLKNRPVGRTGTAGRLRYAEGSGLLQEVKEAEAAEAFDDQ